MARVKQASGTVAADAETAATAAAPAESAALLQKLGFTPVEALVYCALLSRPGASGYRIAHAIGKPQGNTYTALTGLSRKGAVVATGDAPRAYYAVPAEALFESLERRFAADCAEARRGLERLGPAATGSAVVHATDAEEAMTRARAMLSEAQSTVVYELFPRSYAALLEPLRDCTRRLGRACAGVLFIAEPPHAELNAPISKRADAILAAFPDDHMCLAVDGRQFLFAIFDRMSGRLKDAAWTDDPLLAHHLHGGTVSDVILHRSALMEEIGSPSLHLLGRLPASYQRLVDI